MEIEGRTIILSTPEELLPLITKAVRTAEQGKTTDAPDLPGKKLLAPKDVEREFGIHQKTLAYWHMEGVGPVYTNFGSVSSFNDAFNNPIRFGIGKAT